MSEREPACPKCTGAMEEGYLLDMTYGGAMPSKWVEGKPEISFWTGTKTSGKHQIRIATYRCRNCGFLESYAREGGPETA